MRESVTATSTNISKPVIAAGGVVFKIDKNDTLILLIHRKGVWDLPKGKLDAGESIPQCAVREVAEETGSAPPMIVKKLDVTYHGYEDNGQSIQKSTHWYIMVTRDYSFTPQLEEEIDEIRWVPINEAIDRVGYGNLKKVLINFQKWMQEKLI
ncbi:MAG: NUDIX hydrolase [Balneolales bacterium]